MRKTIKQRRIEILKDVLKQLKVGKFKATRGSYLELPDEILTIQDENPNKSAQEVLLETKKTCGVCAKGSLFLSTIRKENKLEICDLRYNDSTSVWEDNKEIFEKSRGRLDKIFGSKNLNLIEAAFEKWIWYDKKDDDYRAGRHGSSLCEKNEKLAKFVKKYPKVKDRLVAIIKNAIRNDGIFTLK